MTISVRESIRNAYLKEVKDQVEVNEATVFSPKKVIGNDALRAVMTLTKELVRRRKFQDTQSESKAEITDSWLQSVPFCLLHSETSVVNYLGMLVAIDFQHWCELPLPEEEKALVGEVVKGFAGFYICLSPTDDGKNPSYKEEGKGKTMVRGSAAMMHLLKVAVDEHNLHWYDPAYLASLGDNINEVQDHLAVCFKGCDEEGSKELWMPETAARIEILLTLTKVLLERNTSFYNLLQTSDGYLFGKERAFIPSLVHLHPRYRDFACIDGNDAFPVLKLSQLTALALSQALPAYWRWRKASSASSSTAIPETEADQQDKNPASFLTKLKPLILENQETPLFKDQALLSICCDYQIPKVLRAAGLLVYSPSLSYKVDHRVLLGERSPEESTIRVATLIAAELLAEAIAEELSNEVGSSISADEVYSQLDYPLWYTGRSLKSSEHHLCHTIMY